MDIRCLVMLALLAALVAPGQARAEKNDTKSLPLEVQIDLLKDQLQQKLKADDSQGVVDLIPQFRALDIELPDSLYFIEGRALYRLGRALEARDRLILYLQKTGRKGTYYQQATKLLLAVDKEADKQEKLRLAQEKKRKEELAQRAEKAQMLRVREAQRALRQLGFRQADETGELNEPTREALAVYQVRRNLQVNGNVTDETLEHLKREVPDKDTCDDLARYPRKPEQFGIPVSAISAQAAIPACNEALRKYPDVVRFQVEYARSLLAANRNQDAVNALQRSLKLGYPESQTLLAWMYEEGRLSDRGRPDYDNALHWYKMAADQNYPEALLSIGRFYLSGRGDLRRDYDQAAQYYSRAANLGYPPAETGLAQLYMDGRGVSRDYNQAHQWLSRAARLGYPDAQYQLGQLYEHGDGVKRDRDTAMDWYRKASNQGDTQAAERLKRLGG